MLSLDLFRDDSKKVLVDIPIALRKAIKAKAKEKKMLMRDLVCIYLFLGLQNEEEALTAFKRKK
jgi:hypothetical protein